MLNFYYYFLVLLFAHCCKFSFHWAFAAHKGEYYTAQWFRVGQKEDDHLVEHSSCLVKPLLFFTNNLTVSESGSAKGFVNDRESENGTLVMFLFVPLHSNTPK